jgi:hypothetical protein
MQAPWLIRRPVAEHEGGGLVGFDARDWERAFGSLRRRSVDRRDERRRAMP